MFADVFLTQILGIVVSLVVVVISFFKWKHSYFRRKKIPYLQPSLFLGNLTNPLKRTENTTEQFRKFYDEMKRRKWKYGGVYVITSPVCVITDLEMLKNVMTKDFHHFSKRGLFHNKNLEPIMGHLLNESGDKWKRLRAKLTPTFSSGKIKHMFETLLDCQRNVLERIDSIYENHSPMDAKEVLKCFTIDTIGSCAFGLECNTIKNDDSPFKTYGNKVFEMTRTKRMKALLFANFPNLARALRVREIDENVSEFFTDMVKDTVEYRKSNNSTRKDFLQLMIDLEGDNSLTMAEITAQSFLFFLAGFETTSTLLTWTLYELAKHQDIQDKVRSEIKSSLNKHEGMVTYDSLKELKYLTQVFNESLRKYPPIAFTMRECDKDYKIPGEDRVIEKGVKIFIPIMSIHYDEEFYPDPERFDPERFNEENSATRKQYTHMPFGEGPRSCIGPRFALMEAKVGIVALLSKYKFTLNAKTREPLKVEMIGFVPCAEGGIWLNIEKL